MADEFSLSIRHVADRSIIRCRGALDLFPSEKLREGVESAINNGARRVVVDCMAVTVLTSAGITALVDTAIRCKELGITLDLRLSDHVRRVLDAVGLWWLGVVDDGISLHGSLQRALRAFADRSFRGVIYGSGSAEPVGPNADLDQDA